MSLTRSVRLALVLAIAIGATAICSTAYGGSRSSGAPTIADGRSPDTRDAAANAHQPTQITTDGRSPDTLDAAATAQQAAQIPTDGRSPDTLDAAADPEPVAFTQPRGFDWGDAGIGASFAGALLTVLLGAGVLWSRLHGRRHVQTT
jgi:hypothetical protein